MIETLSNLSLFLGYILKTAAEVFLVIFAAAGIVYYFDRYTPPSSCNGDCNQGRNCNCKEKKNGFQETDGL